MGWGWKGEVRERREQGKREEVKGSEGLGLTEEMLRRARGTGGRGRSRREKGRTEGVADLEEVNGGAAADEGLAAAACPCAGGSAW